MCVCVWQPPQARGLECGLRVAMGDKSTRARSRQLFASLDSPLSIAVLSWMPSAPSRISLIANSINVAAFKVDDSFTGGGDIEVEPKLDQILSCCNLKPNGIEEESRMFVYDS